MNENAKTKLVLEYTGMDDFPCPVYKDQFGKLWKDIDLGKEPEPNLYSLSFNQMNIEKPEYLDYLKTLSDVSGITVNSFASLMDALRNRMEFFASMGCCVSDHALEYVMYKPYTTEEIEKIFAKRFAGETITVDEMNKFKTAFMVSVGKEYNKIGRASCRERV